MEDSHRHMKAEAEAGKEEQGKEVKDGKKVSCN